MAKVNNNVVIEATTGTANATLPIMRGACIFLITGGNIGSDTIDIDLVEPDGTQGVQYQFNGTSYQLDSSNSIVRIEGPAIVYIDKPATGGGAVGVGAYII